MNVSRYRHQVQFPPKMAICCLPFQGLADSVDKGFREAGHRWHPRFYKVILLGDSEGQLLLLLYWSLMMISDLVMMQGTCPAIYHQYNHLHIIEILKPIETFYHCCPFKTLKWVKCMKFSFRPKEYGLQEAKKRWRSRIESVCYRVCLLL